MSQLPEFEAPPPYVPPPSEAPVKTLVAPGIGLLLVGPWLGHASWHAYCGAVRWPQDVTVT